MNIQPEDETKRNLRDTGHAWLLGKILEIATNDTILVYGSSTADIVDRDTVVIRNQVVEHVITVRSFIKQNGGTYAPRGIPE